MRHRTTAELVGQLELLRTAPTELGRLSLVVRRPAAREREVLTAAELDLEAGLVGDNWLDRATSRAVAEGRHLEAQLTVMSARMIGLLADDDQDRALAGDQLYVDLDLSHANLPTGSRLAIGDPEDGGSVIEVNAKPHNGCKKFLARFGEEATAFVNSEVGRELRLRGLNARVVTPGTIRPGDPIRKL